MVDGNDCRQQRRVYVDSPDSTWNWVGMAARSALVTGAGQGIGKAIAERLSACGYFVVCADLNGGNAESVARSLENGGAGVEMDVSQVEEVKPTLAGAVESLPQVEGGVFDLVVNSAGVTRDALAAKADLAVFASVLDVNLVGSFAVAQATGVAMLERAATGGRGGAIVNISSIVGKTGNIGQAAYASSKAGVVGMTKSLAREWAQGGVRVNAVLPGFVASPMTEAVPDKVLAMMEAQIPVGRVGQPEEIAAAVEFLGSDDASYITGTTLEVTGGLFM